MSISVKLVRIFQLLTMPMLFAQKAKVKNARIVAMVADQAYEPTAKLSPGTLKLPSVHLHLPIGEFQSSSLGQANLQSMQPTVQSSSVLVEQSSPKSQTLTGSVPFSYWQRQAPVEPLGSLPSHDHLQTAQSDPHRPSSRFSQELP